MANIIERASIADASLLPESAREAYRDFVRACGVASGVAWDFEVGESGDDSVIASWIGQRRTDLISEALRNAGAKDGDIIKIIYYCYYW